MLPNACNVELQSTTMTGQVTILQVGDLLLPKSSAVTVLQVLPDVGLKVIVLVLMTHSPLRGGRKLHHHALLLVFSISSGFASAVFELKSPTLPYDVSEDLIDIYPLSGGGLVIRHISPCPREICAHFARNLPILPKI